MNKLELAMAIDAVDLPRGLLHVSMHCRRHRAPVLPLAPCCPSSSSIDQDRTARRWHMALERRRTVLEEQQHVVLEGRWYG